MALCPAMRSGFGDGGGDSVGPGCAASHLAVDEVTCARQRRAFDPWQAYEPASSALKLVQLLHQLCS